LRSIERPAVAPQFGAIVLIVCVELGDIFHAFFIGLGWFEVGIKVEFGLGLPRLTSKDARYT
jgi:hypothetical protein